MLFALTPSEQNYFKIPSALSKRLRFPRFSGSDQSEPKSVSLQQLRSDLLEIQQKADREDKPTVVYEDMVKHWPDIQDLMDHRYLPFDNDDTVAARKRLLKVHHQYLKDTGRMETIEIDTPERKQFREDIIEKLHSKTTAKQDRQAYLIVGAHGAGKSTIAGPLSEKIGAVWIDSDETRKLIPEYQETKLNKLISKEHSFIVQELIKRVTEHKDNMIIAWSMSSIQKAKDIVKLLDKHGYKKHLVFIDTSVENVRKRIIERFYRTGRLAVSLDEKTIIPPVAKFYDQLKQEGIFDTYWRFNNDANKGEKLTMVENVIPENDLKDVKPLQELSTSEKS